MNVLPPTKELLCFLKKWRNAKTPGEVMYQKMLFEKIHLEHLKAKEENVFHNGFKHRARYYYF